MFDLLLVIVDLFPAKSETLFDFEVLIRTLKLTYGIDKKISKKIIFDLNIFLTP